MTTNGHKEHPILFSGPMVRAILEDRKTQTRRAVKGVFEKFVEGWSLEGGEPRTLREDFCPYGQIGDHLWVRETHYRYGYWRKNGLTKAGRQAWKFIAVHGTRIPEEFAKVYYATEIVAQPKPRLRTMRGWYRRPSIFMPRKCSRLTLEITNIRVERLQEISVEDIVAEGVRPVNGKVYHGNGGVYVEEWRDGWDALNAKRGYSWKSNPWVWVISFHRTNTSVSDGTA